MSYRTDLQRKIEKKETEIARAESQLVADRAYVEGLKEALKIFPPEAPAEPTPLRAGSELEKVQNVLLSAGKPLHIDEIMTKLNVGDLSGNKKAGLAGSLSSYAKNNRVFTKPAPNTFGLIEFGPQIVPNSLVN